MKKRIKDIIGSILIITVAMGVCLVMIHGIQISRDFSLLKEESYDTLFLSNYPIDYYSEEDFVYYRGMDILKTNYEIPHGKIMRMYLEQAKASGNEIKTVYLGVDPVYTSKEDVVIMAQENPEISFEIILAYPQIDYWTSLSEEECKELLAKYQIFTEWTVVLANARVYCYNAEEWLLCNPDNYEDTFVTNEAVTEFIMCNSDYIHPFMLTTENIAQTISEMEALISSYKTNPPVYADESNMEIVFIGDSIIGNYTDSTSVPGVVHSLTGATVYNCGYGGMPAAYFEEFDLCLSEAMEALVSEDLSVLPKDEQIYIGMEEFVGREASDKDLTFVINYGLNDYFEGLPIESDNPVDSASYSGAIRFAVKALQENYPDARIILMAPTFTVYYENGQLPQSSVGGNLEAYVEAVIALGNELNVEVVDNYHEMPVTAENWQEYLSDGCHLNETGRFLLANRVIDQIKE